MTDILDRHGTLDRWKAGPERAALVRLLGEAPVSIRLERVHFPGKRPVQLVYAATRRSGHVSPVLAEACADDPDSSAARSLASLRKSRNGQGSALATCPIVTDRASGLVLRRPGLDERLPGLRLLHDPDFASEIVSRLTGNSRIPRVRTQLMAHRLGKRAVLRLDLGDRCYFARLRPIKSGDGETRLARHIAVWEALGEGGPLAIPEPIETCPDIGLSLFGELPGRPPRFDRDHRAIALSLAALRSLELTDLPIHSGADEAVILRNWLTRCQSFLPDLAERIAPRLERVCALLGSSAAGPEPCHRDLHEKQILVDGSVAGILDFDTLSMADPALDPGNLLAHLFFAGHDERPLAQEFTYANLPLWRRAALLRLAMIHAFTSKPDASIRRLLREADS
jgi:hypothetical protein